MTSLLLELSEDLERRGIRGEVFLVGGAAITLAYDVRRATRDVDGVFEPKDAVLTAARTVADRHDLPDDWLNDAVKGFLHGDDSEATPILDTSGLRVTLPHRATSSP